MRCAVCDQAGDNFTAVKVHKNIFVDAGTVSAQGIFEKTGIMPAYPEYEEIACVADDGVLELVVFNLCKELMREGQKQPVFACFGKRGSEGLRVVC